MKAILVAVGSHGDVHPFVGIGLALRRRGHDVTVLANGQFEPLVRRVGLDFASFATAEEYERIASRPELWHPTKGFRLMMEGTAQLVRPVYDLIVERFEPGNTVLVASTLALGARLAQDRLGIPTATIQLQPSILRTDYQTPRLPGSPLRPWQPWWVKRALWWVADRLIIDPGLAPGVNALRAELGLAPVRRIMKDWWNSPDRIICMFPGWFAPPQPDWPPQTRLTGFPLWDERGVEPMPAHLARFLDAGDVPLAFTPGSAMWQAQEFFDAAVGTCRLLNRRGILLSRRREHIPSSLPTGVIHVDFAPFSELLPRCEALVHHGGIGTASQAMAAGTRQLVTPMAHDQPDNAERLERLGVARSLPVKQFRPGAAAPLLTALLESSVVTAACAAVREKMKGSNGIEPTCDLIEQLARRPAATPAKS